jgi:hypothetical protein
MPFSSGAVSYKSSTTESSTIDGLEEATISCGVTAAAAGEKGALSTARVLHASCCFNSTLYVSCTEHQPSQSTIAKFIGLLVVAVCAGAAAVKPNTAPLAGGMTPAGGGGGGGGNTATLGLKRFGG